MRIAFRADGVDGMFTVGLGLLGTAIVMLLYRGNAPGVLEGFGSGAALLAMFMRIGGGTYTKAADVGADLVGKAEQNIPEDDPRNPATIAGSAGGDCCGGSGREGIRGQDARGRRLVRASDAGLAASGCPPLGEMSIGTLPRSLTSRPRDFAHVRAALLILLAGVLRPF
jgi:hypothetical protein